MVNMNCYTSYQTRDNRYEFTIILEILLRFMHNRRSGNCLFPVYTIVLLHLNVRAGTKKVNTRHGDSVPIWIGPWCIPREYATGLAKSSLGCLGTPGVECRVLQIAVVVVNGQIAGGNDKMDIAPHTTVRTVAFPDLARRNGGMICLCERETLTYIQTLKKCNMTYVQQVS